MDIYKCSSLGTGEVIFSVMAFAEGKYKRLYICIRETMFRNKFFKFKLNKKLFFKNQLQK